VFEHNTISKFIASTGLNTMAYCIDYGIICRKAPKLYWIAESFTTWEQNSMLQWNIQHYRLRNHLLNGIQYITVLITAESLTMELTNRLRLLSIYLTNKNHSISGLDPPSSLSATVVIFGMSWPLLCPSLVALSGVDIVP
jgi:hypothetical protein